MITVGNAYKNLKRKYPKRRIEKCYDLGEWYLFNAPESPNDYDSPFYAVNKNDGSVKTYSPLADLVNFKKALKNEIAL